MVRWSRLLAALLCASMLLIGFSSVGAVDGAEVVRPGILTGNIDLNNGSDVVGLPSDSYPQFIINGQTRYIRQFLNTSGIGVRRFYFDYGWTVGTSQLCTSYHFYTPTNGYLAFGADQYYRCNVAMSRQNTNISSVGVLNVGGFHLVSVDGQSFTFYFDQDTPLSSVYWMIGCPAFNLDSGGSGGTIVNFGFNFLSFQTLTGFVHTVDDTQSIKDAIDHQTDVIEDQYSVGQEQTDAIGGFGGQMAGAVEDKLGPLDYASQVSDQLVGLLSTPPGDPVLTLPAFSLTVDGQQHNVWGAQSYNLDDLEATFGPLLTVVRFATVSLVYFAFIRYLHGVWTSIVHGKTIEEAVGDDT